MLTFISSNKWLRAKYGEKLRKYLGETCQVNNITDFGDLPVFQGATAYPMIFTAQKGNLLDSSLLFTQVTSLESPYPNVLEVIRDQGQILPTNVLNGGNWSLSDATSASRFEKMKELSIPLSEYVNGQIYYGIKTGFNEAFIVNNSKKAALIAKSPNSVEIIKQLLVGRDIRKWSIDYQDKHLLYMYHGLDAKELTSVLEHLQVYRQKLEQRATKQEWYELQQPQLRYSSFYTQPKIVYPIIAKEARFAFDATGSFINDKAFIIPVSDLYLLGILNSSFVWDYLKSICSKLRGGDLELRHIYISKIPIPNASSGEREPISKLVQKCLDAKGANCSQWEEEINARVAALYGL